MPEKIPKYMRIYVSVFSFFFSISIALAQQTGKWGDQGDGTYRNPIIAGDYSDPDPIRVGDDYYMVTSTFQISPGVHVLHSRDLVNWETIGAVFSDVSKLGPNFNWDRMNNYNVGVYAPTIRYHDGKFWVFVNCYSGEGFWMATATNPAGAWSVTQIKDKNGKPMRTSGWSDPCPFWDEDGKAYLGSSKPGGIWYSYLFQMTPDGTQLLDADVDSMNVFGTIKPWPYHGTAVSPVFSSEGNKVFKANGFYYLIHIEFLGEGKGTYVLRSKNIWGTKSDGSPGKPGDAGLYEKKKFADDIHIPGQGGFVMTADGRWFWMAQFNRGSSDGRNTNLFPVVWVDGWPLPKADIWQTLKPIKSNKITLPQGSDEFNSKKLHPQWQWNYQPRADKWTLTERSGFLRLYAFRPIEKGKFFKAGNTLCQRYLKSDTLVVTTKIEIAAMSNGQEAGMTHFNGGKNYANIGVIQKDGVRFLKYEEDGHEVIGLSLTNSITTIWFRSRVGFNDVNSYEYSLDGKSFLSFGGKYLLKWGNYRGDNIGIYTYNNEADAGYVDVDWFHYVIKNK